MVDNPNQAGPMCDWPEVEEVDGAKACLVRLSQKTPCHLATNARDSDEAQIRQALQRADLSGAIRQIFCFANLSMGKDDPRYFQEITALLGVQAREITMVGDSLENDIYPALAAGLQAIWFNPSCYPIPDNIIAIRHFDELGVI